MVVDDIGLADERADERSDRPKEHSRDRGTHARAEVPDPRCDAADRRSSAFSQFSHGTATDICRAVTGSTRQERGQKSSTARKIQRAPPYCL
jgi:hypothetical protein